MGERVRDLVPPPDEQRRALVGLWLVAAVGAAAYLAYGATSPSVDLPLYPVPVLFVLLVAATAFAIRAE